MMAPPSLRGTSREAVLLSGHSIPMTRFDGSASA